MTLEIDLNPQNVASAASQVVQTLLDGGLVRLDLEEGAWAIALATEPGAAERFLISDESSRAALMFYHPQAAADLSSSPAPEWERLMRGGLPLIVSLPAERIDRALLGMLPEPTQLLVNREGWVALAPPAGPFTEEILMQLSGPLLVCAARTAIGEGIYDMLVRDSSGAAPLPGELRVINDTLELLAAGDVPVSAVKEIMAQRIVFICTGNTCRSPIAEAMFREMLAQRLNCDSSDLAEQGFEISSAGLAAAAGSPASPESVELCAEMGIDLSSHSSQPLTEQLLERSDRVYTMTAGHREAILSRYPELEDRVEILSRTGHDVTDPIGCGRGAYDQACAEITENLRLLVDELTGDIQTHRKDAESRDNL